MAPKPALITAPSELPPGSSGEFAGWGTSLAWFAHATGGDPQLLEAISSVLFGKDGLALNIVRYNIGGSNLEGEDAARFRAGGAVPCCYGADGCYDPAPDAPQTAYLLRARELIPRDAFVSEAFANSPPYYMTKTGTSRGGKRPYSNNLPKDQVEAYASSLLAALAHFRSAHGLEFDSLSPFNEPGSPAWIAAIASQEGCYFSHHRMNQVLRALAARRTELGPVALVAHEQFCVSDAARDARKTPKALWPTIARVNTHTYDSSDFMGSKVPFFVTKSQDNRFKRAALRRRATANGKDVWVSEYGTGRGAETLARHILRDLSTLLPTAWVYWQAVEEPGSSWGLVQAAFPPAGPLPPSALTNPERLELVTEPEAAAAAAAAAEAGAKAAGGGAVKITYTPQYHVVKLLASAVPRGARLFPVPTLRRRGVGLWLGGGRAAYVLVNPSKVKAPQVVKIMPPPAAGGAAAGASAAGARVSLLDLTALDAAAAAPGAGGDVGPGGRVAVREVAAGAGGAVEVEVPPGHLAVIELL